MTTTDIVIGPTADAQTTTITNEHLEELEESGFIEDVCDKIIAELMPENLPDNEAVIKHIF